MNTYTVEQIETTGLECVFYSQGARREGWVMPNGDLVTFLGYAQIVAEPDTCYTANLEALNLCRKAVAERLLATESPFGTAKSNDGWVYGKKALCTIATFENDGMEVEVALAVAFYPDSARPKEIIKGQLRADVSKPALRAITYPQQAGVIRVLNLFDREGKNPRLKECRDTGLWSDIDAPGVETFESFELALESAYERLALGAIEGTEP